jgi:uncharacterized protein
VFTHDRAHELLEPDECRRLLRTERLGRVALSVAALPSVVPVLYRLVGERVVFGVESDALVAVLSDNIVAFEVDHVDVETRVGWTVLVVGRARPADDLCASGLGLGEEGETNDVASLDRLIGIHINLLSGQRTRSPVADVIDETVLKEPVLKQPVLKQPVLKQTVPQETVSGPLA